MHYLIKNFFGREIIIEQEHIALGNPWKLGELFVCILCLDKPKMTRGLPRGVDRYRAVQNNAREIPGTDG